MATAKTTTKKAEAVKEESRVSQIADSARDYVLKTTATAKDRTDSAYEGVEEFNKGVESTMNRFVSGYVNFLGGVARVSHENVKHALTTVEKVAAAKSLSEAAQIQVDYVRESAAANYDTARAAFDEVRETVTEGAEAVRARATTMWSKDEKKAA